MRSLRSPNCGQIPARKIIFQDPFLGFQFIIPKKVYYQRGLDDHLGTVVILTTVHFNKLFIDFLEQVL